MSRGLGDVYKRQEYGWTKSLISKFLPDPVLKANPHYRKAAPMRLWDEDTVKQVMTTSEFQDAMEKANKRKKSASKAVETKYSNMNHSVQLFIDSITIKVLSDEELKTKALKAKQEWYQCHPCCKFCSNGTPILKLAVHPF